MKTEIDLLLSSQENDNKKEKNNLTQKFYFTPGTPVALGELKIVRTLNS